MWRGRGGAGARDFSSQLRDTLTRGFCPAVAAPTQVGAQMRNAREY